MEYVYVISPVTADPDFGAKRAALKAVARSLGVTVLFPLDRQADVALKKTSGDIRGAKLVLADLTYERPSCYFELGLAEASGADVGIIAKKGTPIHQVGYATEVHFYGDLDEYKRIVDRLLSSRISGTQVA